MKKPQHKNYPKEKSPFFRLGTKKDLALLLDTTPAKLKKLASDSNYKEWSNEKGRLIEEPLPELDKVQKKFFKLFKRIETPFWLKSGKKGSKPQENAVLHSGKVQVINVDILSFYQNTRREYVFLVLKNLFEMRDDVASLLADLLTYKNHLPTGGSHSQIIAFWAYRLTFERIYSLCSSKGIKMSLWVDDISFSTPSPFPEGWVRGINKIFSNVQLQLKLSKTKHYSKGEFKIITGSAAGADGKIYVRNSKRQEIRKLIEGRKVEDLSLVEVRSFHGKVAAQRQNEPTFFENLFTRSKRHLKNLNAKARTKKIVTKRKANKEQSLYSGSKPPWE